MSVSKSTATQRHNTYHDTKRKTQPCRQEGITVLDFEVFASRELANDQVDAYDRCCLWHQHGSHLSRVGRAAEENLTSNRASCCPSVQSAQRVDRGAIAGIPMPLTTAMIQPRVSLSSMLRGAAGTFLRDVDVDRARGQGCLCEVRRVEASLLCMRISVSVYVVRD
jgi:hypothetical protein